MDRLSDRELLERMIALDTTSAKSNRAFAELVAGYLAEYSREIELVSSGDEKVNLIALFGPESDREGLTLSGHMDTVPATEPDWSSEPFLLREADGNLYGRGTADMKGFLAIALNAISRALDRGVARSIGLALTHDEEIGCVGAHALVENPPPIATRLPRQTLIGEPTSLEVVRMHKGHSKLSITIPGKGAHSGYPHLGVNAIERATPVLAALSELRAEFEELRTEESQLFSPIPFPPLNIATISGGTAINIVPDACTIEVGFRPLPGMDRDELFERIELAATKVCDDARVEMINESPPMASSAESPLHKSLLELNEQTGSRAVSFATDAGWLQELDLECVVWGPGAIEVAHKPDEFIPIDEMTLAAERLDRLIDTMCGAS